MKKRLAKIIGISILNFFIISLIIGYLNISLPGTVINSPAYFFSDIETKEDIKNKFHLGENKLKRMEYWVKDIFSGTWGYSHLSHSNYSPVSRIIKWPFIYSMKYILISYILSITIAVYLTYLSHIKKVKIINSISKGIIFFSMAIPIFLLGLIINNGIAENVNFYNALIDMGMVKLNYENYIYTVYKVIPHISLIVVLLGYMLKFMDTATLSVLKEEYIKVAYSKGLSNKTVYLRHILKNIAIIVITPLVNFTQYILTFIILLETAVHYNGLGSLIWSSIKYRDFPVFTMCFIIITFFIILGNVVLDILYVYLDPRIRYERQRW